MSKFRMPVALLSVALILSIIPAALAAQNQQQPQQAQPETAQPAQAQPAQPATAPEAQKRSLWIAKFETDANAAGAVASTQMSVLNGLKYGNLFEAVKSFETDATQPEGTWRLAGKELEFKGGSAATRALIGLGAGRSHITMQYTLYDPANTAVWTQKITTKPSFWGSAGVVGAIQDQSKAMDQQGQKLVDALTKFFSGGNKPKK